MPAPIPFIPRNSNIEAVDSFDAPETESILESISRWFNGKPRKINRYDKNENPSERITEMTSGVYTGVDSLHDPTTPRLPSKRSAFYYAWDMNTASVPTFLGFSNRRDLFKYCKNRIGLTGFLFEEISTDQLTETSERVKTVTCIAYYDETDDNLRVIVRASLDLTSSPIEKIKRTIQIVERTLEYFFVELRGFSAALSPCITPTIPKIVSLGIEAKRQLFEELQTKFISGYVDGNLPADWCSLELLQLLPYDGSGFPSVILDHGKIIHILWRGKAGRDCDVFYFIGISAESRLLCEPLRHALPAEYAMFSGGLDRTIEALEFVVTELLALRLLNKQTIPRLKSFHKRIHSSISGSSSRLSTRIDENALHQLLGIDKKLLELHEVESEFKQRHFNFNSTYIAKFYAPELPMLTQNIFDAAKASHSFEEKITTLSSAIKIEHDDILKSAGDAIQSLNESVGHSIFILNSRIQITVTKWTVRLALFTLLLILITLLNLFRFAF